MATYEKDYTYDSKYGTWKLVREKKSSFLSDSVMFWCEMEHVLYTDLGYLMWSTSEIEGREWREIKGLDELREDLKTGKEFEMVNYGGKLLVMWHPYIFRSLHEEKQDLVCKDLFRIKMQRT